MNRVLVVDDEPQIRRALRTSLEAHGYEVQTVGTGEEAVIGAAESAPELMLLDLGLPDLDGTEVIRRVRGFTELPIIVLSVRDAQQDKVAALDAGADDYVTKPFEMPELVARIRAVLRRSAAEPPQPVVTLHDLEIDPAGFTVRKSGRDVTLTATEFRLLLEMARRPGQVFTREVLLQRVWDYDYLGDSRLVDMAVQRLRSKIEDDPSQPRIIRTVRGVGYRLEKD